MGGDIDMYNSEEEIEGLLGEDLAELAATYNEQALTAAQPGETAFGGGDAGDNMLEPAGLAEALADQAAGAGLVDPDMDGDPPVQAEAGNSTAASSPGDPEQSAPPPPPTLKERLGLTGPSPPGLCKSSREVGVAHPARQAQGERVHPVLPPPRVLCASDSGCRAERRGTHGVVLGRACRRTRSAG